MKIMEKRKRLIEEISITKITFAGSVGLYQYIDLLIIAGSKKFKPSGKMPNQCIFVPSYKINFIL